jgi:hypothetical protein
MNSPETPASLDEACQRFSRFLRENGYSEQILWIERLDIVWHRRQLFIRERPQQIVWDRARRRYEEGIRNGHGVLLHAFSELGGTAVAAIILPKDEDAAQRHLIAPGGLKLSVATNKLSASRITNRLTWWILAARYRTSSRLFWDDYLDRS